MLYEVITTFSPASSATKIVDNKVEVVVTDAITGVNETSLKYVWTMSSTQPDVATITNSFTNGDKIEIPTSPNGNYYLCRITSYNVCYTKLLRSFRSRK